MSTTGDAVAKIDTYIAARPGDQRTALEHLRAVLLAAAPDAEEAMIYGVPGLKQNGALVCYAAFKAHCGFYPMSPATLEKFAPRLTEWETAKGTVRFTPDHPLPDALISEITQARIAENARGQS